MDSEWNLGKRKIAKYQIEVDRPGGRWKSASP